MKFGFALNSIFKFNFMWMHVLSSYYKRTKQKICAVIFKIRIILSIIWHRLFSIFTFYIELLNL